MFSARNTDTPNPFRPALQYLLSAGRSTSAPRRRSASATSLDSDSDRDRVYTMSSHSHQSSSSELHAHSVPLITLSRSPSPFARKHAASSSVEVEDDDDDSDAGRGGSGGQSHLLAQSGERERGVKGVFAQGGFGRWLFATPRGWQAYVAFQFFWVGSCGIGLSLMNRIVLLSKSLVMGGLDDVV